MRLAGVKMVLQGAEGFSPPLPFINVDDAEGETLLALNPKGIVQVVGEIDDEEAKRLAAEQAESDRLAALDAERAEAERLAEEQAATAEAQRVEAERLEAIRLADEAAAQALVDQAEAERLAAERAGNDSANGSEGDESQAGSEGDESQAGGEGGDTLEASTELLDAFDLLDADDFVKTGARAGRPKVDAVKNVLDREVTIEEIDAAWAAKTAA